jgi:hypothetical protein
MITRLIHRLLALSFAVGLLAGCHSGGGEATFMSAPVQPWWPHWWPGASSGQKPAP